MFDQSETPKGQRDVECAREWVSILSAYRAPDARRSLFELGVTLAAFLGLWALAWWSLSVSYALTLGLSVIIAAFLVRLFAIQHDCGHGAFFASRAANDWLGRCLGVLTLTPYAVWRHTHSVHHSGSGNLGRRGMGDIYTMTVEEYRGLTTARRFQYRLYRHPITLFLIVPGYLFLLQNRLPIGVSDKGKFWVSAMGTNLALFAVLGAIFYVGGLMPLVLIFLPSTVLAGTAGVWLFYVQHQFETTLWEEDADWDMQEAALHGSSHYLLPPVLQWLSANIGIHHVHHLYSRIPFYRLPEVLCDHALLADNNRLTIWESLQNARLHLWDDKTGRLLSFREARALYP